MQICGHFRELKISRGCQVFDAVSFFKLCEYMKKDLGGGEGVASGTVPADDWNREVAGDRVETMIEKIG